MKYCSHCGHRLVSGRPRKWQLFKLDSVTIVGNGKYNWWLRKRNRTGKYYDLDSGDFWNLELKDKLLYLKKIKVLDFISSNCNVNNLTILNSRDIVDGGISQMIICDKKSYYPYLVLTNRRVNLS